MFIIQTVFTQTTSLFNYVSAWHISLRTYVLCVFYPCYRIYKVFWDHYVGFFKGLARFCFGFFGGCCVGFLFFGCVFCLFVCSFFGRHGDPPLRNGEKQGNPELAPLVNDVREIARESNVDKVSEWCTLYRLAALLNSPPPPAFCGSMNFKKNLRFKNIYSTNLGPQRSRMMYIDKVHQNYQFIINTQNRYSYSTSIVTMLQ